MQQITGRGQSYSRGHPSAAAAEAQVRTTAFTQETGAAGSLAESRCQG